MEGKLRDMFRQKRDGCGFVTAVGLISPGIIRSAISFVSK